MFDKIEAWLAGLGPWRTWVYSLALGAPAAWWVSLWVAPGMELAPRAACLVFGAALSAAWPVLTRWGSRR